MNPEGDRVRLSAPNSHSHSSVSLVMSELGQERPEKIWVWILDLPLDGYHLFFWGCNCLVSKIGTVVSVIESWWLRQGILVPWWVYNKHPTIVIFIPSPISPCPGPTQRRHCNSGFSYLRHIPGGQEKLEVGLQGPGQALYLKPRSNPLGLMSRTCMCSRACSPGGSGAATPAGAFPDGWSAAWLGDSGRLFRPLGRQ